MPAVKKISPFPFLTWKDDDAAVVVSTGDDDRGYLQVLSIDGINIDDIVDHAKAQGGSGALESGFAANFPAYVAAVAAKKGSSASSFVATGKAHVEYADMTTAEVGEVTLDATEAFYNEAVRIEEQRSAYNTQTQGKKGKKKSTDNDDDDDDDDDDYEDIDDDDDDEEDEEDPEAAAYMSKRRLLEMVSTQLETAMTIAYDLGVEKEDIIAAYKAAVSPAVSIPMSQEECTAAAAGDMALQQYLANLVSRNAGAEGVGAGMGMEGMPPEGAANCQQQ